MSTILFNLLFISLILLSAFGLSIKDGAIKLTKMKEIIEKNKLFWATAFEGNKIILSVALFLAIYAVSVLLINLVPALNTGLFENGIIHFTKNGSYLEIFLNILVNVLIITIMPSFFMEIFSILLKKSTLLISVIYSVILLFLSNNFAVAIISFIVFNFLPYLFKYFNKLNENDKKMVNIMVKILYIFGEEDLSKNTYNSYEPKSIMDISQVFAIVVVMFMLKVIII